MNDKQTQVLVDGNQKPINDKATLVIDSTTIDLSTLTGTTGQRVVDLSPLVQQGYLAFDPGFLATASCESAISYIDGVAGILLHRGYPIEQLALKSSFLELAYLLLYGELPSADQSMDFCGSIAANAAINEQMHNLYRGFRYDAHPMSMMVSVVGALSAFCSEPDIRDPDQRLAAAINLIAKMPTIAAMCYKHALGQPFVYPRTDLSFAANFLHMMYATPGNNYVVEPRLAASLDKIFILHADHGQNASTSTVRVAGSTGANPYACLAAGIGALWGPAHGGANEAALNMLHEIGDVSNINKYIKRAKDPNDDFRLMGFGHRIYKNYDPRAVVMRDICHEVLDIVGSKQIPIFKLALELEKIALEDEYFIARKLYPNVDFYCGIVLSALGIPSNMFTVIFALARTSGWLAQWHEMLSGNYRLSRPKQLYTGVLPRDYPL